MKKFFAILTMALFFAGNAWGEVIGNMNWACLTGSFYSNTWEDLSMTRHDNNHYSGKAVVPANRTISFKIKAGNNSSNPTWSEDFGLSTENGHNELASTTDLVVKDGWYSYGNEPSAQITTLASTTGWVLIEYEFWGSYDNNSRLKIKQTANVNRYVLCGSAKENGDPTKGMPGWSTSTQTMYDVVTTDKVQKRCVLEANTTYKFKIWDRAYDNGHWAGQKNDAYMSNGANWSFDGTKDVYLTNGDANTLWNFTIRTDANNKPSVTVFKVQQISINAVPGADYYSTFYDSQNGYVLPEGVEAFAVEVNGNTANLVLAYSGDDNTKNILPHNCGVILRPTDTKINAASNGTIDYRLSCWYTIGDGTTAPAAPTNNSLKGTDEQETTPTEEGSNLYYKLSRNSSDADGTVGFYWGAANGGVFTNGAHKAYLVVPQTPQAPNRLTIVLPGTEPGITTGVAEAATVQATKTLVNGKLCIVRENKIYDLNGRIVK